MKKLKKLCKLSVLLVFLLSAVSCSIDEIEKSETLSNETDIMDTVEGSSNLNERISSTQWNVQSACITSANFTTDISGRYNYESTYLVLNVLASDKDINCNTSGNPRTELRGTKEFKPSENNNQSTPTHAMYVTMKIEKLSVGTTDKRVIIGQLFNKSVGDDYGTIYIQKNKLYANFDGETKTELDNSINEGDTVSFSIITNDGKTTISSNGKSKSSSAVKNDICYFKTGAYLISRETGHRAQVRITNLSQR